MMVTQSTFPRKLGTSLLNTSRLTVVIYLVTEVYLIFTGESTNRTTHLRIGTWFSQALGQGSP